MAVHVVPVHDGWSVDETERWLDQGLLLPDVDPPEWAVVECDGTACGFCEAPS
ncbi:MAG: hypothetical protein AAGA99_21095 [Actinomycetota bacterium]